MNQELQERPAASLVAYEGLPVNLTGLRFTSQQFEQLCELNPELLLELTSAGDIEIMPPTSMESGWKNSRLTRRLDEWAERDGTGVVYDSSTMFRFPDGAMRSPDASWIRRARVEALSLEERQRFAALVPDFVAELRSPTDRLADLQAKMAEYIANGVRLGWLIDPPNRTVYVYRASGESETLTNPDGVSGEDVLPDFVFDVTQIW